jgi:hypothetical protein
MDIVRGKSVRDILPANFIHNITILKAMAGNPLFMPIYLLLRNRAIYNIAGNAVSEVKAEEIADLLGYSVDVVIQALEAMQLSGWIKICEEGYSVGAVSASKSGDRIHYFYAQIAASAKGEVLEAHMLDFKNKFRERYLYKFKTMYRGNGYTPKDDKVLLQVVSSLYCSNLPILKYIDFIFDIVVPSWEKEKPTTGIALTILSNRNILKWYEDYMHKRVTGSVRQNDSPRGATPETARPKIKIIKGTLPDV